MAEAVQRSYAEGCIDPDLIRARMRAARAAVKVAVPA